MRKGVHHYLPLAQSIPVAREGPSTLDWGTGGSSSRQGTANPGVPETVVATRSLMEVNRDGQGHHPHAEASLKQAGQKICHGHGLRRHASRRILDDAGADVLLVGDSSGDGGAGERLHAARSPWTRWSTTARAVTRGAKRAHVVGDMPVPELPGARCGGGAATPGRLVAEGGVGSVKLEGGEEFADTVAAHRPRVASR